MLEGIKIPKSCKERKQGENFKCPVCGATLELLTHVHVAKHGMTKKQFLERYPEFSGDAYWGTAPIKVNENCTRAYREARKKCK